jgi:hypothetical protein
MIWVILLMGGIAAPIPPSPVYYKSLHACEVHLEKAAEDPILAAWMKLGVGELKCYGLIDGDEDAK